MNKNEPESIAKAVLSGQVTFDEIERDPDIEPAILRNARIIFINLRKAKEDRDENTPPDDEAEYREPEGENTDDLIGVNEAAEYAGMRYHNLYAYLGSHPDFREKYCSKKGKKVFISPEGIEVLKDRKRRGSIGRIKKAADTIIEKHEVPTLTEKTPGLPGPAIKTLDLLDKKIKALSEEIELHEKAKAALLAIFK